MNILRYLDNSIGFLAIDNLFAGVIAITYGIGIWLNSVIIVILSVLMIISCVAYLYISQKFLSRVS